MSTGQELGLGALNAIRPDVPAWMVPAHKLQFPLWFLVEDEVVFLSKGQRRAVEWQAEQNASFLSEKGFSFPLLLRSFAHVRNVVTNEWIGCEDEIGAGYYQVDFRLCEVPIQPIGRIQVHPLGHGRGSSVVFVHSLLWRSSCPDDHGGRQVGFA